MSDEFTGCKLAYILSDSLLVYKRDKAPEIPFPGLWDFPGGGREGDESSEECVLRELKEEFSISLPVSRLSYKKKIINQSGNGCTFFFVTQGEDAEISNILLGDEGQYWKLVPVQEYLSHPKAIPALISRLKSYLEHKIS